MDYNSYQNPLTGRYAGPEMNYNWSPHKKHSTWRRLWLTLAEEEQKLGLDITDEQIAEMRQHLDDVNFDVAEAFEKELRHDVMSHVHAFGQQCPKAMPIIHLGATSCYVTDNTELIQMRDGLKILKAKLLKLIAQLADFCDQYRSMPTLGFTHYQPAQLTTVGKRFALYLQDFMLDLEELEFESANLPFGADNLKLDERQFQIISICCCRENTELYCLRGSLKNRDQEKRTENRFMRIESARMPNGYSHPSATVMSTEYIISKRNLSVVQSICTI